MEYYDRDVLTRIGDELGQRVKVDHSTSFAIRGKFVRLCVEIDLTKPLVSKVFIGGRWQRIEYEGLRMLSFHCGQFGHSDLDCMVRKREEEAFSTDNALKLAQ